MWMVLMYKSSCACIFEHGLSMERLNDVVIFVSSYEFRYERLQCTFTPKAKAVDVLKMIHVSFAAL